jgi:hypothetical protein
MNKNEHKKSQTWEFFENLLIYIFIAHVGATFIFNLLRYLTNHGFQGIIEFVFSLFHLASSLGYQILAVTLAWSLVLFCLPTLILLILSIAKPAWFKRKFRYKYWYGIFSAQILTLILIYIQ